MHVRGYAEGQYERSGGIVGGGCRRQRPDRTGGPRPGESEAGVPARGAYNENAPAEGDAAATAAAADWGENAAVCVTEGAPEEVGLSLTGGLPPAGLDFEDMIALIGARNAERCGEVRTGGVQHRVSLQGVRYRRSALAFGGNECVMASTTVVCRCLRKQS